MANEQNEYLHKSQEIRKLAALPPDQLTQHLTNAHPRIDNIAPNLAPQIFSTAVKAVQFLNSKLPGHGNELTQDHFILPSKAQQHAWLQLYHAVDDPIGVLEHINHGTLTNHHVEAVKGVYPDLHQEMSDKIQSEIGARKISGQDIPYYKRIALAKFLGQPLDSTMTQPVLASIIHSATGNTGPASQAAAKPASGAELNQINKTNAIYATPSQSREILGKRT